ncbi:MAG: ABC transporter permease [Capsulimonadaceae bacterium]|nr:ABC transporter permease [Capsulimonadaceae bacterium]
MFRIMVEELRAIFTTRTIASVMLGGPLAYALMFGGVYSQGRVRQAPIMVVDQDHSALSRNLIQMLRANDSVRVEELATSTSQFAQEVQNGRVWACVSIPQGFEKTIERGRQTRVLVSVDGGNTLYANVILKSLRTVMGTFRAGVRASRLSAEGMPELIALATAQPIGAEFRPLFNPTYNYGTFILVGLMCIALQQCTMMGGVTGLSRPQRTTSVAAGIELTGKTLAHLCVMLPVSAIALSLPFTAFGSFFHGDWRLLATGCVIATIVNIWSGFGLAATVNRPVTAVQLLLCASVPIFVLSGYTYPTLAEPQAFQTVAGWMPLTHYWHIARCVALIGAPGSAIASDVLAIALWLPVTLAWAWWAVRVFRRRRGSEAT